MKKDSTQKKIDSFFKEKLLKELDRITK